MDKQQQSFFGSFLICPADHFDVIYEINAWMHIDDRPDHDLVVSQWSNYQQLITSVANQVETIKPQQGVPDLVYTANFALVRDQRAVLAAMKTPERQKEEPYYSAWFEEKGFETYLPKTGFYEGEGDSFLVDDCLLYGSGFRSEKVVAEEIKDFFALNKIIHCELTSPYFYHLDTCLAPLGEGRLLVYPEALTKQSLSVLAKDFELIEVVEAEAQKFCCNIVVFQDQVIMPAECPDAAAKLEDLGFTVHPCSLTTFLKGGGAAKCLCLKLWN